MCREGRVGEHCFQQLVLELTTPLESYRSTLPVYGVFGHLEYTGTALWIDPIRSLSVALLTSRLPPDRRGDVQRLLNALADMLRATAHTRAAPDSASRMASPPVFATLVALVRTDAVVLWTAHFAELRACRSDLSPIRQEIGRTAGVRSTSSRIRQLCV